MKMWNRINKKKNYKVHLGVFSEENKKERKKFNEKKW